MIDNPTDQLPDLGSPPNTDWSEPTYAGRHRIEIDDDHPDLHHIGDQGD